MNNRAPEVAIPRGPTTVSEERCTKPEPRLHAGQATRADYLRAFASELGFVRRTLRRHGIGAADAEDLAQEVFLVAWRRWPQFDPSQRVRPWLAGIAVNVVHHHRRRRRPEITDAELEAFDAGPGPERSAESAQTRALVSGALARLPERHRVILVLHELEGLAVEAIAARLRVPLFTAYTRLRRARIALRAELARTRGSQLRALAVAGARRAPAMVPARAPELRRWRRPLPGRGHGARIRLGRFALLAGALVATLASFGFSPSAPGDARPAAALTRSVPSPAAGIARAPVRLALPPPTTETTASANVDRDLVGHWSFDDPAPSAAAIDRSGHGHHCVLHQLDPEHAWVAGQSNGALELGLNGWLECAQPALPRRPAATLTVTAWVKRAGHPRGHHAIASRPMGAGRANYFFFGFRDDRIKLIGGGWRGTLEVDVPHPPGVWMHLAFTHAGGVTRIYLDGETVAERRHPTHAWAAVDQPLFIGGGLDGRDRTRVVQLFEGALDEVRVYERALAPEEIRALALPALTPATRASAP